MESVLEAITSGQLIQLCTATSSATAVVRIIAKPRLSSKAPCFELTLDGGSLLQFTGGQGQFVNFSGRKEHPNSHFSACLPDGREPGAISVQGVNHSRWLTVTDSGVLSSCNEQVPLYIRPAPPAVAGSTPLHSINPEGIKSPFPLATEAGDLCTPWHPVLTNDPMLPSSMPVARVPLHPPHPPLEASQLLEFGERGYIMLPQMVPLELTQAALSVINDEQAHEAGLNPNAAKWRHTPRAARDAQQLPAQHSSPLAEVSSTQSPQPQTTAPGTTSGCGHGPSDGAHGHSHGASLDPVERTLASKQPACQRSPGGLDKSRRRRLKKPEFPQSSQSEQVTALLYNSPAFAAAEQLMGAGNVSASAAVTVDISSWHWERYDTTDITQDTLWRLDSSPTSDSHKPLWSPFSVCVAVALTDVHESHQGNFTLFPRSHHQLLPLLRDAVGEGRDTSFFFDGGLDEDKPDCGAAEVTMPNAGDVFLVHHKLAHCLGPHLVPKSRFMVFFKLDHVDHAELCESGEILRELFAEFQPVDALRPEHGWNYEPPPDEEVEEAIDEAVDEGPAIWKVGHEWRYRGMPDGEASSGCMHHRDVCENPACAPPTPDAVIPEQEPVIEEAPPVPLCTKVEKTIQSVVDFNKRSRTGLLSDIQPLLLEEFDYSGEENSKISIELLRLYAPKIASDANVKVDHKGVPADQLRQFCVALFEKHNWHQWPPHIQSKSPSRSP